MLIQRLKCLSLTVVLLALVAFGSAPASAGVISNGDFAAPGMSPPTPAPPFADWMTDPDPLFTAPVNADQVARFTIKNFNDSFVQLSQTFRLMTGDRRLTFDFLFTTIVDGATMTDPPSAMIDDSFQATLFDRYGKPVSPSDADNNPPLLPAFFAMDAAGREFKSQGVTVDPINNSDWKRVTLDISSLMSDEDYTIEFLLLGGNDGRTTTVDVDNVALGRDIATIPEPASLAIWGLFGAGAVLRRRRRIEASVAA